MRRSRAEEQELRDAYAWLICAHRCPLCGWPFGRWIERAVHLRKAHGWTHYTGTLAQRSDDR